MPGLDNSVAGFDKSVAGLDESVPGLNNLTHLHMAMTTINVATICLYMALVTVRSQDSQTE